MNTETSRSARGTDVCNDESFADFRGGYLDPDANSVIWE